MIYNSSGYKVYYYQSSNLKRVPVSEYIQKVSGKEKVKIAAYINFLRDNKDYINEPYSRYICSEIRELRVGFSHNKHRIFYTVSGRRKIILLYAFLKKTQKTPKKEINHALNNLQDYKLNKNLVEYEAET
jgi:phage-related protein